MLLHDVDIFMRAAFAPCFTGSAGPVYSHSTFLSAGAETSRARGPDYWSQIVSLSKRNSFKNATKAPPTPLKNNRTLRSCNCRQGNTPTHAQRRGKKIRRGVFSHGLTYRRAAPEAREALLTHATHLADVHCLARDAQSRGSSREERSTAIMRACYVFSLFLFHPQKKQ